LFYLVDLFVLCVYIFLAIKNKASKSKVGAAAEAEAVKPPVGPVVQSDYPPPEAFLEEAKQEPKRKLLMDHIGTINTLRDEKKFTFRAIAEWLAKRGVETDHSAVYRTYLAATPPEQRDPRQNWSEIDEPGYGDESAK
jgi:hypothetical protein